MEMLTAARDREEHARLRENVVREQASRPVGRDFYALRNDGSEFPVEIALTPTQTENGLMVLSTVIDISERKQREERIRAALDEKELLLGEIHHRVKNNLQVIHSLLDLQAMRIKDPTAQRMLRDSENRIRSMSLIHQTLYQSNDFAGVDFQYFLRMLSPALMKAYGPERGGVELNIDVQQVQLPIGVAIPCGLIVNELVTNALKHGFANGRQGNIWIELASTATDEISLAVSNDGAPIPEDLNLDQQTTLGMQLVRLLTEQIHGRSEIQRAHPTRFTVRFPFAQQGP